MRISLIDLCLAATVVLGCGHHGSDGGADGGATDGLIKLLITPADETLMVSATTAATESYVATGAYADGHTADVTSLVTFYLDDGSLGGFPGVGGSFTSATGKGGRTNVNGMLEAVTGATTVTLFMQQSWNDPASTNLPADPAAPFNGPVTASRNPDLVYPNDGVVVPPNLGKLELHFHPGSGNTLFELTFQNALLNVKVYLRCTTPLNGGCVYLPDPQLWSWLSDTNRGGDPVTWSIRGTDDAGTGVGTSGSMAISFAPDDLSGGIYYWSTTAQAVLRWDFASATQVAPMQFIGNSLEGQCIGCHALSRDGTKLVAETGGQWNGGTALVDVATTTVMNSYGHTTKSNFESWRPDGSVYVGVWADNADYDGTNNYNLKVMNGTDATLIQTIDVGGTAAHPTNHPDWSADGQRIAFSRVGTPNTLQESWGDSIYTVAQSAGVWGTPTMLVPTATNTNRYYPAFAPDGRLLVYDESHCTSGNATGGECDGDTDPDAKLWAIDSMSGSGAVEMANANKPGIADAGNTALTDSFPKWNPFVSRTTNAGGHLAWVTFSSQRQFGLRNPSGKTWLWMAAVDLDAIDVDPSSVAFALPFQDLTTSNHIAQWTEVVVGTISSVNGGAKHAVGVAASAITTSHAR